jgi:hypothetical protein
MVIVEDFQEKKVFHHMMERKNKNVLFILPSISSLKSFDPILEFLREKFPSKKIYSGLLETLKNRQKQKDYVFISLLNKEDLQNYDIIFKLEEIFDYGIFIIDIIGYQNIPNIKLDKKFNFVLDYYSINEFVLINVDTNFNIDSVSKYINSFKIPVILIGDAITCAELTKFCTNNPIIIYNKNIPLIVDLLKKSKKVIGNKKPDIGVDIKYDFYLLNEEMGNDY